MRCRISANFVLYFSITLLAAKNSVVYLEETVVIPAIFDEPDDNDVSDPKPDEHFAIDESLNEVIEIGSEVEVVVDEHGNVVRPPRAPRPANPRPARVRPGGENPNNLRPIRE
uniref:Secreted protein n=1 Tax=Bursaphelenchus xylophilus TaxID=6326 RepID=A0A1I7RY61_BURXY